MISQIDKWIGRLLIWVSMGCFLVLFVLIGANVANRVLKLGSMSWSDEIVELTFAWTVFLGATALWRRRQHFRADMLLLGLGEGRARIAAEVTLELLCVLFLVTFTWLSMSLLLAANDLSSVLGYPRRIWYAPMPLAGLLMTLYSLRNLVTLSRGQVPG